MIHLRLILSVRPGLGWMVTVPLTWTCTICTDHLFFCPFFKVSIFLKYHLLGSIIVDPSFLVFSHEVLMDKMFSSLCDGMPICNQWNVVKHVSVKIRLPGLLLKVECTPACMVCIAIDNASSTYCAALVIFCRGLPCNSVLRTLPTVWCILSHTALDCGLFSVVHTSLM
jgi:hypothetical protein